MTRTLHGCVIGVLIFAFPTANPFYNDCNEMILRPLTTYEEQLLQTNFTYRS